MIFIKVSLHEKNDTKVREWVKDHPNFCGRITVSKEAQIAGEIYYDYDIDKGKYRRNTWNDRNRWKDALSKIK